MKDERKQKIENRRRTTDIKNKKNLFYLPLTVYLYKSDETSCYDIEELRDYLHNFLSRPKRRIVIRPLHQPVKKNFSNGTSIEVREEFFERILGNKKTPQVESVIEPLNIESLAREIVACRVLNDKSEIADRAPLAGEIDYEKRRFCKNRRLKGIIYDGFRLQDIYKKYLRREETSLSFCHIILTNQHIGAFDSIDKRYHLRVSICGIPSIISTAGLIEALAKPKEYYIKWQLGIDPISLKKEFKGKIINEGDNLTEFLKIYYLQAIFYHLTGEAFCENKTCLLYNAHWQEEIINQRDSGKFCKKHSKIILPLPLYH